MTINANLDFWPGLSPLNFDASDLNNRMSSASLLPRPMSRLLPVLSSNSNDKSGSSVSAKRRVHRYQFRPTLSLCDQIIISINLLFNKGKKYHKKYFF
ncbi:hypothetical protein Avbf_18796 [Armadillidium vulgare]|nr:hypothetical protein Avbf_18796 [Armadillidium vulgare]